MKKLVLSTALLVLGVATLATPAKAAKKATKFSLTPSTTAVTRKSVKVSVAVKKKAKKKKFAIVPEKLQRKQTNIGSVQNQSRKRNILVHHTMAGIRFG